MSAEKLNLNDVMTLEYGGNLTEDERNGGDVPVYGSNGRIGWHNEPLVEEPSIMVARKGSIGSVHYEENPSYPIDVTYYIPKSSVPDNINHKYLYYYLDSVKWERFKTGTSIPSLSRGMIQGLEIPVPPVGEQERIVSLLSDVDEYIEKTSERVHALEQSKQAVLQQVFAVKGDDINTINPQYRWHSQPMGEICSVTSGSSFPQDYQDNSTQGIPVIKVGDLQEELYIDSAEFSVTQDEIDELGHTVYDSGTIILPKNGESIRTAKVNILDSKCAVDNNVMVISVKSESILSEWVAYFLDYYDLIRIAPGTTAPTISNKTMNALEIPVPSKEEQENTISTLSQIDYALGKTNEDLESMCELKQGLLQDIFDE